MNKKPKYFILDVDGVLSSGQFYYDENGKLLKKFGPHDSDGLKIIKKFISIKFITADNRGFKISKKRIVDDMGYDLSLVKEEERYNYINSNFGFDNTIFMGDSIHDAPILKKCFFGISPNNARIEAKQSSNFITPSNASEGAVMDACMEVKKFFE